MSPSLAPPSHTYTSFPILAVAILGILATAILLLVYYLFIAKCCCLRPCRHLLLFPSSPPTSRSRSQFDHPTTTPQGLDPSAIHSIPTFRFVARSSAPSVECMVCLAELRDNDLLRRLPRCSHSFHVDCIDTWLQSSRNCPLCRHQITLLPVQQYHYLNNNSNAQLVEGNYNSVQVIREGSPSYHTPRSAKMERFWKMESVGDEWIEETRGKNERIVVDQPIRRSISMDSSNDRQLYISVQEIIRQNPGLFRNNGEGSSNAGGMGGPRTHKSIFSFGWSSRTAASVAPPPDHVHSELEV